MGSLVVEDVFAIKRRGCVVIGKVLDGTFRVGDRVQIVWHDERCVESAISGIEKSRTTIDIAQTDDYVGLLLQGIGNNDVHRGDVVRSV